MSRAKGNIAEDRAVSYLIDQGFEIVDRNFYTRFGEIDIIALKSEVLHFIEVKSALDYELAIQNITPAKLKKILRSSDVFLKKHAVNRDYCIDALIVEPIEIVLLENITL